MGHMYGFVKTSRYRVQRAVPMRRALSLLELLVVIGVIALLIGMLVPSLKRTMVLTRSTVCKTRLHQLGNALTMYRHENDGWLPMDAPPVRNPNGPQAASAQEAWFLKLFPMYVPDLTVLTCPDDPYRFRFAQSQQHANNPFVADFASYGINSFIMAAGGGFLGNLDRHQPTRPLDTILVADLGPDEIGPMAGSLRPYPVQGPLRNGAHLSWDDRYDPYTDPSPQPWITVRHGEGINVLTITSGVRAARTVETVRTLIRPFYTQCAQGGCTLCNDLRVYHYSFARSKLFWWTGPVPSP